MRKLALSIAAATALAIPATASAQVFGTWVGFANYTGSRSIGTGLTGTSFYGTSFDLAWSITPVTGGFQYSYTISSFYGPGGGRGLSHVLLGLSANCATLAGCVQSPTINGTAIAPADVLIQAWTAQQGNNNLPGTLYGVKFDVGGNNDPTTYSFVSNRIPVWGSFYAKGGGNPVNSVWNSGQANLASSNITDFVATPDSVVPEPASMVLLGTGLATMAGLSLRRRRRTD